jgi:hypothetical protein
MPTAASPSPMALPSMFPDCRCRRLHNKATVFATTMAFSGLLHHYPHHHHHSKSTLISSHDMRLAFFTVENGILYRRNKYKSRFARSRTRYRVPNPQHHLSWRFFGGFFLVVIFCGFLSFASTKRASDDVKSPDEGRLDG